MEDSMLQALMAQANKPLLPQIGQAGQAAENAITEPKLDDSVGMAQLKGFGGGAVKGLSNLVQAQTSPLALLALLASGGLGMAGRGARSGASAIKSLMPTLGESAAEFAPVGGEAAYNAGRAVPIPDPNEQTYLRMLQKFTQHARQ